MPEEAAHQLLADAAMQQGCPISRALDVEHDKVV